MTPDKVIDVLTPLIAFAKKRDGLPMSKHKGCWEQKVDEHWEIAVNGHTKPKKTSKGITVAPFHLYVEFNGWPAGMLSPTPQGQFAGAFAAGSAANIQNFIEALQNSDEERRSRRIS